MPDEIELAWFPHAVSSWGTYARYLKVAASLSECFSDDEFGRALVLAGYYKPRTRESPTAYLRRYAGAPSGNQPWRTMARMTSRFFRLIGWMERCEQGGSRLTEDGMTASRLDVPSDAARDVWIEALMALRLGGDDD